MCQNVNFSSFGKMRKNPVKTRVFIDKIRKNKRADNGIRTRFQILQPRINRAFVGVSGTQNGTLYFIVAKLVYHNKKKRASLITRPPLGENMHNALKRERRPCQAAAYSIDNFTRVYMTRLKVADRLFCQFAENAIHGQIITVFI